MRIRPLRFVLFILSLLMFCGFPVAIIGRFFYRPILIPFLIVGYFGMVMLTWLSSHGMAIVRAESAAADQVEERLRAYLTGFRILLPVLLLGILLTLSHFSALGFALISATGVMWFGGGCVLRVPFAWRWVCEQNKTPSPPDGSSDLPFSFP